VLNIGEKRREGARSKPEGKGILDRVLLLLAKMQ
jgi:hypothetical protein